MRRVQFWALIIFNPRITQQQGKHYYRGYKNPIRKLIGASGSIELLVS